MSSAPGSPVDTRQKDGAVAQVRSSTEERVERSDESSRRARIATREPSVARVDESGVMRTGGKQRALERAEVADVLSDKRALLTPRGGEHIRVGRAGEKHMTRVVNRDDVVIARAKRGGDGRRVHLVEQQPQASSSRSRASAASSRSASASFAAIQSSISSGNSA